MSTCPKYRIKKDVSRQKPADLKLNSNGQKEVNKKIQRNEGNISGNENKEQFKIAIESKTAMSSNEYTELKQTKSGRLALELDEHLIDMIEKKSQEYPSLFISIKRTASGNLLVDFNTNENEADTTHKVAIRRTSSGTRLLDIHKNIINFLKGSLSKNSEDTSKSIKLASGPEGQDKTIQMITDKVHVDTSQLHDKESIVPAKTTRERKKDKKPLEDISSPVMSSLKSIEEVTKSTFGKTLQRTDKIDRLKLPRQESLEKFSEFDFRSQFKKLYKKGNADVAVQIKGKDGVVHTFSTVVTKTTSGTIAIYIDDMTSLKHITYINNEYPVLLSKVSSRNYFVNFEKNGRVSNAILRKTPSGGMFVIPETRSLMEMHSKSHTSEHDTKLKIMGLQPHSIELPATLQTTPSLNYLIVLDKNDKKEPIIEFMQDKKELIVDLHKTNSGNYMVNLGTEGESHLKNQKALIYKSSSDDLKVLIQKDIFESIVGLVSLESSSTDSLHVVGKFPASSREIHRGNLRKTKNSEKNASSNTQVYDDFKAQDKTKIFSETPAVLKKTDSGQYAVVLNKKSKKAFINNLHSFLSTNSEGLVPIKRSDSGEIIIDLNSSDKSKGHYGTLKITPSGDIYVVVDEGVIKTMTDRAKNVKVIDGGVGTTSQYETDLIVSVNKAITTTCNGQPDDCDCDAAKCVCSDFQLDTFGTKKIIPSVWKNAHLNASTIYSKKMSGIAESTSRDKSPHIVIKPQCDCRSESKQFGSMNQCYFLIDSVCPYHQKRYEGVSNEILEITGLCNTHKKQSNNKIEFEAINHLSNEGKEPQVWDSLKYLPPQLPPFLNIEFR